MINDIKIKNLKSRHKYSRLRYAGFVLILVSYTPLDTNKKRLSADNEN
jgi:hypothetical protein